jgi:hypothetical protein
MQKILIVPAVAVAAMLMVACSDVGSQTRQAAEANQTSLRTSHPVPRLQHSEELDNLIRRANVLNQINMTGCVDVYGFGIGLLWRGFVDGKVSSLNSYLLPGDEVRVGPVVVEAPDVDGAYGENAQGIFFFTPEGAYMEFGNATYAYTDQCLQTTAQPLLVSAVPAETE